jgi:hypothetical protein
MSKMYWHDYSGIFHAKAVSNAWHNARPARYVVMLFAQR